MRSLGQRYNLAHFTYLVVTPREPENCRKTRSSVPAWLPVDREGPKPAPRLAFNGFQCRFIHEIEFCFQSPEMNNRVPKTNGTVNSGSSLARGVFAVGTMTNSQPFPALVSS